MANKLSVLKYISPLLDLALEVVNAKKDGRISNDERSRIMKKFWKVLKVN